MAINAKICGLSTAETIGTAIRGGAHHIGFVFFAKSPRNVSPEQAGALIANVPDHIGRVGVFVDPDDDLLARATHAGLSAIQLHGKESPERAAAIRDRFGLDIWKAIPVKTRADLAGIGRYRGAAHRILYDAKTPESADLPGGLGLRFDWKLLEGFAHPLPWALSGGLDPSNVAEAVRVTRATLVDVSSGVETAPGIKSDDRVIAFLQALKPL